MQKSKAVPLVTPNEKMPFELTPMYPHLSRLSTPNATENSAQNPTVQLPNNGEAQPVSVPTNNEDSPRVVPAPAIKTISTAGGTQ